MKLWGNCKIKIEKKNVNTNYLYDRIKFKVSRALEYKKKMDNLARYCA